MSNKDYLVRATAADAQIRAFAVTTKNLVEEARSRHDLSPVVTAALGRLLSGACCMGSMLKGEKDILTLQINGDGPVGGLTVTADAKGNVKGYALSPQAMMPPNAQGKLDVGGLIGNGYLTVIKDMGMKDPYSSQVALQTGEIGDDLTYYFAASEQVPSCVALGVLMERNNTVKQAGGFIIQLMPYTDEKVVSALEKKVAEVTSVTDLLERGVTPEALLEQILGEFGVEVTEKMPVQYSCNCSKERVTRAIASIGKKDIREMVEADESIEVNCQFCDKHYVFTPDELKELLKGANR